ncbi:Lipoprotein-releasing system transmembrane protein LolE [bacterium HR33]|nr:Lipoprotein-releasing system transmembrane protein LolE [bacterium HR33]
MSGPSLETGGVTDPAARPVGGKVAAARSWRSLLRLELAIAGRYLRSRRSSRLVSLITLIATGGVTVGVMALIVVLGVMNGLQEDLREKILVASPHLRVLTYGEGLRLDDWKQVASRVREDPEVLAVAPFVISEGLISAGADYAQGVRVLGIATDTGSMSVTSLPRHFVYGDLSFKTRREGVDGGIVLGRRLAERLSAYPGDTVTVVSPAGSRFNAALGAFIPRFWRFEVTGHFETGMYEYDNSYVVLPLEVAQRFAGLEDAVSGLDVRIRDPWRAPQVGAELEQRLGYPYRSVDWQTQNSSLFSALQLEKLAMGLILLLIVIVAAFNIVSTLTMVVTDKTREIGILRAMGLSAGSIKRVFIWQGAVIGVVGTLLGAGLGLTVAWLIDRRHLIKLDPTVYFIDHLPVRVDPVDFLLVVGASMLVATLATIYPARQAAMMTPVEAIRWE